MSCTSEHFSTVAIHPIWSAPSKTGNSTFRGKLYPLSLFLRLTFLAFDLPLFTRRTRVSYVCFPFHFQSHWSSPDHLIPCHFIYLAVNCLMSLVLAILSHSLAICATSSIIVTLPFLRPNYVPVRLFWRLAFLAPVLHFWLFWRLAFLAFVLPLLTGRTSVSFVCFPLCFLSHQSSPDNLMPCHFICLAISCLIWCLQLLPHCRSGQQVVLSAPSPSFWEFRLRSPNLPYASPSFDYPTSGYKTIHTLCSPLPVSFVFKPSYKLPFPCSLCIFL